MKGGKRRDPVALKEPPKAMKWVGGIDGHIALLDQTLLPAKVTYEKIREVEPMWDAIRRLAVRGAPAIGIAAAYGVVVGVRQTKAKTVGQLEARLRRVCAYLASSRPTAVNLFWALERMERVGKECLETLKSPSAGAKSSRAGSSRARSARARPGEPRTLLLRALLTEARQIHAEDRELCEAIGKNGAKLLQSGWNVLTHCHAGALATGGAGTALSVIYGAVRTGKTIRVFADETRPLLQGARLTAWELRRAGVDVALLCDGAAASLMSTSEVHCVVVGADRIAANGDVANKIGTYSLAVLAREHGIPFYVAAPSTTFDMNVASGKDIPIEQRAEGEVTEGFGRRTAPRGTRVYNPAFDVTPAKYIAGIITEVGVLERPYRKSIAKRIAPLHRG